MNARALKKLTLLLRFLILSRCRTNEDAQKLLKLLNEFEDECNAE